MELSSVIRLTTDPDQLAKLRNKAAEYVQRYAFTAPECLATKDRYKLTFLAKLLEKGELHLMDEIREECVKPGFDEDDFQSVMNIINAYNSGDLSEIRGGTGLRAE